MDTAPVVNKDRVAAVGEKETAAQRFLARVLPIVSIVGATGVISAAELQQLGVLGLKVYVGIQAALHLYQAALPKIKLGIGFVSGFFGKKK